MVAFPMTMATTDEDGVPSAMDTDRAEYLKLVQLPKTALEAARLIIRGRPQLSFVTDTLLVRERDGWKVKATVEGGYGAMPPSR
jgi:hypothetical protein